MMENHKEININSNKILKLSQCYYKLYLVLLGIIIFIPDCTKKTESSDTPCTCLGCETGTLTDIDNITYRTIRICNKWWMAENLATLHLNDGTPILNIIDDLQWQTTTSPAYCAYNNDYTINYTTYGALYNFYVVKTQKLCPSGWHVATNGDWISLAESVGDTNYGTEDILTSTAGGKLKEKGIAHWEYPNTAASDTAGFTALPGGFRSCATGTYYELGTYGYWYSSDEDNYGVIEIFEILHDKAYLTAGSGGNKNNGCSVRCVKDN